MSETRFLKYKLKVLNVGGGSQKIVIDKAIVAGNLNQRGYSENETVLMPGSYTADQLLAVIKREFPAYVPTKKYTISATVSPASSGSVSGAGQYEDGATCVLTATPASGYVFKFWDDDMSKTSPVLTITVSGDESHKAVFEAAAPEKVTLTLNVSPVGSGDVTGSGSYDVGSNVNISATAKTGYRFKQWSDGNVNSSRSVVVNSNMTLTAEFEVIPQEKKMYKNAYVSSTRAGGFVQPTADNLVLGDYVPMTDSDIANMLANGLTTVMGDSSRKYTVPVILFPEGVGVPTSVTQSSMPVPRGASKITIDGVEYQAVYMSQLLTTGTAEWVISWN